MRSGATGRDERGDTDGRSSAEGHGADRRRPAGPGRVHQADDPRRREIRDLLRENLRRAVGQGEVRPDLDVDITADHILAFTTGAQIQYFLAPDDVDLVALYESFTASLLRDLAVHAGDS